MSLCSILRPLRHETCGGAGAEIPLGVDAVVCAGSGRKLDTLESELARLSFVKAGKILKK